MLVLLLAACDGTGTTGAGDIDTSTLFPIEDSRFQAFRHLEPGEYEDGALADVLDETDLLMARYEAGGCDGGAWRVELRTGETWGGATTIGALHLDDARGLAICAWEDADAAETTFSPSIVLWEPGGVAEGETLVSGDWSVTATRQQEVKTYFGRFPLAVAFGLAGGGALDGWTLTFAPDFGLVLIQASDFTADLVYTR